jgi:hypothetical protein
MGRERYPARPIDIFGPWNQWIETTQPEEQACIKERGLQGDPFARHDLQRAIALDVVVQLDQLVSLPINQL